MQITVRISEEIAKETLNVDSAEKLTEEQKAFIKEYVERALMHRKLNDMQRETFGALDKLNRIIGGENLMDKNYNDFLSKQAQKSKDELMLNACYEAISKKNLKECVTFFKEHDPEEWLRNYYPKEAYRYSEENKVKVSSKMTRVNTKNINIPNSVMNESLGLPADYNLDEEHKIFITDYIQKQFDEGNIKVWGGDLEGTIMKYLKNLKLSVSISE